MLVNFFHGWIGAWNGQMAHCTDKESEANILILHMRRLFISYRDENGTDWETGTNVGKLIPDQPRRPPTNSTLMVQGSELCAAQRALHTTTARGRITDTAVPP